MIKIAEFQRRWREEHEQKLTRQREKDVYETVSTLVTKVIDTVEAEETTLMLSMTTTAFTLLKELQNKTTPLMLSTTTTTLPAALFEELRNSESTYTDLNDFLVLITKVNNSNQDDVMIIDYFVVYVSLS
jgi:hypothetical protein